MRTSRVDVEITGNARDAISAARDTDRAYGDLNRSLGSVDGNSRKAGGGLAGLAGGAARVAAVGVAAGAGLAAAGVGAYKLFGAASDAAEATTAAAEVFGVGFAQIETAAGDAARAVGLSSTEYIDAAKTFGVFGAAAGKSGTDLAGFSQEMITAAADMASFHNAAPTEAIEAIGAGLRGEAEPLRRFGILMDDATLRSEALKLGLIATEKEALTPQNKTLAAQALIMSQLGAAQGDWARTSDGAANQQRILVAQVKDLAAQLGEKLLPVGLQILTWLNEAVAGLTGFFGALTGGTEATTGATGALGGLRDTLGPLAGAFDTAKAAGQFLKETLESKARTVANVVGPALDGMRDATDKVRAALERNPEVIAAVKTALGFLKDAFKATQTATEGVADVVGPVLGAAFSAAGTAISGLIDFAGDLITAFNSAKKAVSSAAEKIKDAIGGAKTALKSVPILGRFLGSAGPILTTAAGPPGLLATAAASGWLPALSVPSLSAGSAGGATYVLNVTVNGALDPVAVADQIRGIVRADMRRTGRPWPA